MHGRIIEYWGCDQGRLKENVWKMNNIHAKMKYGVWRRHKKELLYVDKSLRSNEIAGR
jgi:hypothetical protein